MGSESSRIVALIGVIVVIAVRKKQFEIQTNFYTPPFPLSFPYPGNFRSLSPLVND